MRIFLYVNKSSHIAQSLSEVNKGLFGTTCRLPSDSKQLFLDDRSLMAANTSSLPYHNIIIGDLNLHLGTHDTYFTKFSDILSMFNFTQLINTTTHVGGHIIAALFVSHLRIVPV